MRRIAILLCLTFLPALATAESAIERLDRFFREVQSFEAGFKQVVSDADGKVLQTSYGNVKLARPGKFRWDYRRPIEQLIVADGQFIWIYDIDLEQIMVRGMDEALGTAPITLLSEYRPLENDFTISDAGRHEGLDWVTLEPKKPENDFVRIELGLGDKAVDTMILHDQLGQKTWIRFTHLKPNPVIPPETFRFEAPPGVDVIRP